MDFFTTLRILLSRWQVVVPALALTALAAAFATQTVAPAWQATGTMVLLGPSTATEQFQGQIESKAVNPYLEFGGALDVTAEVLSKVMVSDTVVQRLRLRGATAEYEVGTGSDGGSPIINIIATGRDAKVARRTVQAVATELRRELQRRQTTAGAPTTQLIRAEQVTVPSSATRLIGDKVRAAAAVLAMGVAFTFSLAFLTESVIEQRARRRRLASARTAGAQRKGAAPVGQAPPPPTRPPTGQAPAAAPRASAGRAPSGAWHHEYDQAVQARTSPGGR